MVDLSLPKTNLKLIETNDFLFPIYETRKFKIDNLGTWYVTEKNCIVWQQERYICYDLDSYQKKWEWAVGYYPLSILFCEDQILCFNSDTYNTDLFDKETGGFIKSIISDWYVQAIFEQDVLMIREGEDQNLLGRTSIKGFIKQFKDSTIWEIDVFSDTYNNVLLTKDIIILNNKNEVLVCYDWQTGGKLWEINGDNHYKRLGHNIFNTRQVIWKDNIISAYGDIISLDIHTGEKKWQKTFKIGINGVSVDSLGRLYALTRSKYLVLDAESGDIILEKPIQEVLANFDYSEIDFQCPFPIITDQHIIFSNGTSHLLFVNKFTGEVEWSYHFEGAQKVGHPLKLESGCLFLVVDHKLVVMEEGNPPQG